MDTSTNTPSERSLRELEEDLITATIRTGSRVHSCAIINWVVKAFHMRDSKFSAVIAGFILFMVAWSFGWLTNRFTGLPVSLTEAKGLMSGSFLVGLSYWIIHYLHEVTLKVNRRNIAGLPQGEEGIVAIQEWFEKRFSYRSQVICSLMTALLALVSARYLLKGLPEAEDNVGIYVTIFAGMFAVGNGIYCCLKCPTLAAPLVRHPIKLYPYDPANTVSVQEFMSIFGKLSLGCGFVVTVIMLFMSFVRPWQDQAKLLLGLAWLILGWAAVTYCFVFPFMLLSKVIRKEKLEQLRLLEEFIRSRSAQAEYEKLSKEELENLKKLIDLRDAVFKTRNSLIDTLALRSYISSLVLPLLSFLVANRALFVKLFRP